MDQRTRRSPARFLAPLALIAVVVAFAAVVTGGGNDGGSSKGSSTSSQATAPATSKKSSTTTKTAAAKAKSTTSRRTYTVKVGDTLGGIADKVGIPLEKLQELNPDVDSHAMVAGQKIRLR